MEKTYTQMQEQKNVMALQVIKEQEVLGKQFKIYGTFEEPLFLAKDVAEWIDYSKTSSGAYNISKMLMTIDDDDEKIKLLCDITISNTSDITISNTTSQARKTQEMWFLTEDGLYEVLMQSRKPIAKAFKKEVKQILKQIRRTGGYIPVQVSDTQEMIEQRAKEIASKTIAVKDELIAQQQAMIEQQQQEIAELQEENEVKESEVVLFMNDVRYLFNKTDYGCHSISEAFELVTGNVNGKRRFVKWFKENNSGYVDVLDSYVDERGSKIVNAIDLTEINTFHRFKDLCFDFLKQESKDIR